MKFCSSAGLNTKTFFWLALLFLIAAPAHSEIIKLDAEHELNIEVYGDPKTAKYHVLWLPSERGITGELQKTVLAISKQQNIHIVMPDWHASYFITPSRSSLDKIPVGHYYKLIEHYASQFDPLFLVTNGKSAPLAMQASNRLQQAKIDSIDGIIMLSPYLQVQTPEIGKRIQYQQITAYNNLPLYIFQAERSPRFVPLPQLLTALENSGAQVYSHVLKGVTGGYHQRNKEDLKEIDMQALAAFPKQISNALAILSQADKTALRPYQETASKAKRKKGLRVKKITFTTPPLNLNDIDNKTHNLEDYKGKAIIVSFWASWCRPCIDEMPSLVKLKKKYQNDLEILAVNIREDKQTILKFTDGMNINFPLILDSDNKTAEDWRVYVYPSNYLLDKQGNIQYAATGALDWQEEEIDAIIKRLTN